MLRALYTESGRHIKHIRCLEFDKFPPGTLMEWKLLSCHRRVPNSWRLFSGDVVKMRLKSPRWFRLNGYSHTRSCTQRIGCLRSTGDRKPYIKVLGDKNRLSKTNSNLFWNQHPQYLYDIVISPLASQTVELPSKMSLWGQSTYKKSNIPAKHTRDTIHWTIIFYIQMVNQ